MASRRPPTASSSRGHSSESPWTADTTKSATHTHTRINVDGSLISDAWNHSTVNEYFTMIKKAESCRTIEHDATVAIQSVWRGYRIRKMLRYLGKCATLGQKIFRAHQARRKVRMLREKRWHAILEAYHHRCATTIQRVYRGWHSRKYIASVSKRRMYLEKVGQRGDLLLSLADRLYTAQLAAQQQREADLAASEFAHLTSNIHHLVSTKSIPGVYGSPFTVARVAGIPVEQHITQAFRTHSIKARTLHHSVALSKVYESKDSTALPPVRVSKSPFVHRMKPPAQPKRSFRSTTLV